MHIFFLFILLIVSVAEALPPRRYFFASFGILCEDSQHPAHLKPLSFIEFKEQVDPANLPAISAASFTAVAPRTFKHLDKRIKSMKLSKAIMHNTYPGYVDALVKAPFGCVAERMVQKDGGSNTQDYKVLGQYWDQISPELQRYYLIEAASQEFLREDLAPVDFRRFTLYVASGAIAGFTQEQKKFFLAFHGIHEL